MVPIPARFAGDMRSRSACASSPLSRMRHLCFLARRAERSQPEKVMIARIYFDHSATTPLDPRVLEAMLPYLDGAFGNPSSLHREGRIARDAVQTARAQVADLIGADPKEIILQRAEPNPTIWLSLELCTPSARRDTSSPPL